MIVINPADPRRGCSIQPSAGGAVLGIGGVDLPQQSSKTAVLNGHHRSARASAERGLQHRSGDVARTRAPHEFSDTRR